VNGLKKLCEKPLHVVLFEVFTLPQFLGIRATQVKVLFLEKR